MGKKISDAGAKLVAKFEGYRDKAYRDAVGVLTIGYGHTGYVKYYNKNVFLGMSITQEQALELLKDDLAKAEQQVNKYDAKYNWNQNEFDALVSFAFNTGNINQLTANGTRSKEVIAEKILLYNKADKKELEGLTTRRKAEQALFLSKESNSAHDEEKANTGENTSIESVFKVKVTASTLNIRKGPGTDHAIVGSIKDKGTYTIIKTQDKWGYLKSGVGWICLDFTNKL